MNSQIDYGRYVELLQAVASMSRLYSDNPVAYVDSRFVERLFIQSTGAKDLSRSDKSFDALVSPDIGVGVKTFLSASGRSKREKVAEFPRYAPLINRVRRSDNLLYIFETFKPRIVKIMII